MNRRIEMRESRTENDDQFWASLFGIFDEL
jgi:hypothetical protein